MEQRPVCLTIGGSDSCSGAGIQADLRVFEACGVHGCSAVTALTAQNPREITRIEPVSLAQLDAELHAIFDYFNVAAVKTGMLLDAEHIAVISAALANHHAGGLLVVDPVMVASSGRRLLDAGSIDALAKMLLPKASLMTPNLDEAAVLLGHSVADSEKDAGELAQRFGTAVLLKGGHADVEKAGEEVCDLLCLADGEIHAFTHPRLDWDEAEAHGTGCRLSAAITAFLAQGLNLPEATERAIGLCAGFQ